MKQVFLTGISGFLGSHTAIQLLEKDYQVIGSLRDLSRAKSIKDVIHTHTSKIDNLSFVEADLNDENIWQLIIKDVDYVQHIPSPFPTNLPKKEDDLILPAKNGVLNVLKAASQNGVERVVVTSSAASIVYGKEKNKRSGRFDETTWTDETNLDDNTSYSRSKTIAEKLAWEFIKKDKSGLELTTVCPGLILGPLLEADFSASANVVIKALNGMPGIPQIGFDALGNLFCWIRTS